ncbi:L-seryl-tRNA(Sec) selenium transferase [Streptomyces tibetensis]|uniref:L-seryl-tRNA(Sec) selenium transferase n=1 Tax=Streptomyces tibetensis TaxID=2382123 RepID=UPI0033F52198
MTTARRAADDPRRRIPGTDSLLADLRLADAARRLGHGVVKEAVHTAQRRARGGEIPPEAVADLATALLPRTAGTLRPVLNATGVVLHTNLGRAPLSAAAVEAVQAASGYVDVEFDTESGTRARRGRGTLAALRAVVPRAEEVHVVNNGAAALVLAATVLAAGREIVVSRGELIEIGDGFRLPDLLVSTGAQLREVGTTNRTHLDDYRRAIGPRTGFLLKIHPSNFRVEGFTSSVSVADLATLGPPVVADIGSGLLTADPVLPEEPDADDWLAQGADLVTASGDKLLGGPQAGLLLGTREVVDALRAHPLARALRVDKLTLAALEATLLGPRPPAFTFLHADAQELRARAEELARRLTARQIPAGAVPSDGIVGGGGAPGVGLPGWAVRLPSGYTQALRAGEPCVVGRAERGHCLLDLRCVPAERDGELAGAVLRASTVVEAEHAGGRSAAERRGEAERRGAAEQRSEAERRGAGSQERGQAACE